MSNRILVRSGQGIPTTENLEELELGFDKINKKLYIRSNNEIIQIGTSKEEIIDSAFPIKSIFITTNSANPGTYLGGIWEAFGTGKTLIAVDTSNTNFNTVEKTGGQTELNLAHTHSTSGHMLTTSEIPSHSHSMTHTHSDTFSCASNSHSHGMSHKHSDSFSCASGGSHTHDVRYKTSDLSLDANSNYSGYKLSYDHNYTNKLPAPTAGGHARYGLLLLVLTLTQLVAQYLLIQVQLILVHILTQLVVQFLNILVLLVLLVLETLTLMAILIQP